MNGGRPVDPRPVAHSVDDQEEGTTFAPFRSGALRGSGIPSHTGRPAECGPPMSKVPFRTSDVRVR